MSNNLGQIYATTREENKYIIIDSQNVEVSGNLTVSNDVNINNIKPINTSNGITISDGHLYIGGTYGIMAPSSGDFLKFGIDGTPRLFYTDNASGKHCFTPYNDYDGDIDLGRTTSLWNRVYAANGSIQTSDDRLKINESPISNSLEFIRRIDFYEYDKVKTLDGNDIQCKERGVIAQHLLNTDLEYILEGGKEEDLQDEESGVITRKYIPYGISYNDIFVTNCKATKELDALVQNQQNEINDLKAENILIKSKLNELLSQAGKQTI